jgi:L-threonylcarbamoyladenylate synthase
MGSSVNIPTIKHTDPSAVETAVSVLKNGGLIIYPTETCYGIGVDATNPKAVNKLLTYKARREGKPISIAVSDKDMAQTYVVTNETAENLYENFLPGPLTVVSQGTGTVAPGIESEYGTLGVRIPDYPLILDIITKLGHPITATSANVSYKPRPYSIDALLSDLPEKQKKLIDLIIDAGELPNREVSTVVDTTLNSMNLIREGQIDFDTRSKNLMEAHTLSPEETKAFGSMVMLKHMDILRVRPLILALGGELGAGKTQFTKGIAKQLGIQSTVKSPTYTLIHEYPYSRGAAAGMLIHIDTWRIGSKKEFLDLTIPQYLTTGNVVVIEWADKFFQILPELARENNANLRIVRFERISDGERVITIEETL